jgi:uncharacterized BrkB/YihY/UPF0761 family membrane protein
MNLKTPKKLATIGGALISVSGLVNAVLGIKIGALLYDVYPGGRMGHVGIVAGIAAIAIGLVIVFVVVPLFKQGHRGRVLVGGILTIVLGHLGAIAGAIYIGTVGVALCYIAGIWLIVEALREARIRKS